MPIDPEEVFAEGREWEAQQKAVRNGHGPATLDPAVGGTGRWSALFERQPEGGGFFEGRNNACYSLAAFLRAKNFPYEAAQRFAQHWNDTYCTPPLGVGEVEDIIARAWAKWPEGGLEDKTPEDALPKPQALTVEMLTSDDLLALDAAGGGIQWLVPNVLVMGGVHILSAPAAGAKSWLCLDLCRALASGGTWLGRYDLEQTAVLYWDEEMGKHAAATRVQKLGFPRGVPFYYLARNGLKIFDAAARAEVARLIRELNIGLLVVDTVTGVFPGLKENEAEHVSRLRAFFREFTGAGATVLVLHHDRKGGTGDSNSPQDRMAGSRDFAALADMAYGIDKRGDVFQVITIKNRHLSADDEMSVDFVLEDDAERTTVTIRALGEAERVHVAQAKTGKRLRHAIGSALMDGAMKTKELCDAVKGSPSAVIAEAKAMVEEGLLTTEKASGQGGGVYYSLPPTD